MALARLGGENPARRQESDMARAPKVKIKIKNKIDQRAKSEGGIKIATKLENVIPSALMKRTHIVTECIDEDPSIVIQKPSRSWDDWCGCGGMSHSVTMVTL